MTASTFVSVPRLSVGGTVDAALAADLLSLTVEENTLGLTWCEARFANYGNRDGAQRYRYLGRDVLDFGTELAVTLGPAGESREVFAGRVSALQADYPDGEPAQLLAFAEDGLQRLRMTRRTRSFESSSTADLARRIAGDHGLGTAIDLDGPTRAVTAQLNQSDLAFLRALARRDDGEVWLEGTTLHAARRPSRTGAPLELRYGSDLLSFSVRADLADQCTEVAVTGWDVAAKEAIAERADSSALGAELGSAQTSGSELLAAGFAERTEMFVRAEPLNTADARAMARAAYLERARRLVCGTGITGGTATLRVGAPVRLAGLGQLFDGEYTVTRARHMVDLVLGYRTEFDVERPGVGAVS